MKSAPLFVLPGLLCDARLFSEQLKFFPGSSCLNGFYNGAASINEMAQFALSRMPQTVSLLGHSMGARIALEVWRLAPERVERLALASTGVHPVRADEPAKRYALRDLGRERGILALVDSWLPPMLGMHAQSNIPLVERLRTMCIDAGLATYEAQIKALITRPEAEALLGLIECPTWIMAGSDDVWSPPGQHRAIASKIRGCTLRIFPQAGHMLPAEKPQEFNNALAEWLAMPTLSSMQTQRAESGTTLVNPKSVPTALQTVRDQI